MAGIVPSHLLNGSVWVKRYSGQPADGSATPEHGSATEYSAHVKNKRVFRRTSEGGQVDIVTHVSIAIDIDTRDLVSETQTGVYTEPKDLLRSTAPYSGLTRTTFTM